MRIVAIDDLGGLGTKEGAGVLYAWVPPSFIPLLLPWLGVLLLLLLKANRSAQTWLIWLPLLLLAGIQAGFHQIGSGLPMELGMFAEGLGALTFGIAAVWLTGHLYGPRHRLLGFLGMLGVLAGFGVAVAAVKFTSDDSWSGEPWSVILLGFCTLVLPVALSLSALCCRGRYRPVALFLWLMLWLPVGAIALTSPFVLFATVTSPGGALWGEYLGGMLLVGASLLGTLTPFLVLSFAHPFFRKRLQELLRLGGNERLPVMTPAPIPAPNGSATESREAPENEQKPVLNE